MTEKDWTQSVLTFWFEELTPKDWFHQNDDVDTSITSRFGDLYNRLRIDPPDNPALNAETVLAAIIVLDQFPRNMFRGRSDAFGSDNLAAALTRAAVDAGLDAKLEQARKPFMYMPLMHSESLADQEQSVMLFRNLGNENNLAYAIEHRDVIASFGRFPHRNKALGRKSTPEELEYLKSASGYGQ